jgi:hypothetical protein
MRGRRRPVSGSKLIMLALLVIAMTCNAQNLSQDVSVARELTFHQFFATRQGDPREYILLGGGWLFTVQSGNPGKFVSDWLAVHAAATIRPISRRFSTNTKSKITSEMVYIWVEDGNQSLNEEIIRAGMFPGAAMYDMVDNQKGLERLLQDPRLAEAKALTEKQQAAAPQDRAERLIADGDYQALMRRIDAAEQVARKEKRGIWSDAMKQERQEQGYP